MKSRFGQQDKKLNELADEMRGTRQRLVSLEQDAQQPRLAIEEGVQAQEDSRAHEVGRYSSSSNAWG